MEQTPPKGIGPHARKFWQQMTTDYIFETHEIALLEVATRFLDEAHRTDEQIEGEGRLIPSGRGGRRPNPLLKHARDSRIAFAHVIERLRLHRAKLEPAPAAPADLGLMRNRRMVSARRL